MVQYIDKAAVVAEMEKIRKALNLNLRHDQGVCDGLYAIQKYINSLEVKEVDLKKEIENYLSTYWPEKKELHPFLGHIAKNFFELGLRCKSSYVSIPNIDDTLKEMGIDPDSKSAESFKEFYYMALEKFKAQKGE